MDKLMWANQIEFFLNKDQKLFDMNAAYGHPGATIISFGSFLYLVFGISCAHALKITIGVLVAGLTAGCAVFCRILFPHSRWWVLVVFVMLFSRFNVTTPTSLIVMHFVVFIFLYFLCMHFLPLYRTNIHYIFLGILIGLSAATRVDATLLMCAPIVFFLVVNDKKKNVLFVMSGTMMGFWAANPFMWFMPWQHLKDLIGKFFMHYQGFSIPYQLSLLEWINSIAPAIVCIGVAVILYRRQILQSFVPLSLCLFLLVVVVFGVVIVSISSFQATRYLHPLVMIFEVFLPLFVSALFVCKKGEMAGYNKCVDLSVENKVMSAYVFFQLMMFVPSLKFLPAF